MKKIVVFLLANFVLNYSATTMSVESIIEKIDNNLTSTSQISDQTLIIYGERLKRTMRLRSYGEGYKKSFTEFLSPRREKGTKMLKLKNNLWIYSPSTDRTIRISGHMLRQSMMGSDISYEDMMEERKLMEIYEPELLEITKLNNQLDNQLNNRQVWVVKLTAKVDDTSYPSRKIWVDQQWFVPLQEELYGKSGRLLKKTVFSDIKKISGRWYPTKINFKDMLKNGKGTEIIVNKIQFNPKIPAHIFSKAALRR